MAIKEMIVKVVEGRSLRETEAAAAMLDIVEGLATPSQIAAFVIGIFPESGLNWLQEKVRSVMNVQSESTAEAFPLQRLDGMNIYHRARLIDEGVENLENLAHADLFALLLETRFPLGTLVDWVDQAILLLHVGPDDEDGGHYAILRDHGIRNATDLERAWQAWEEVLDREHGNLRARLAFGRLHEELGRAVEAERLYRDLVERHPTATAPLYQLGRLAYAQSNPTAALA